MADVQPVASPPVPPAARPVALLPPQAPSAPADTTTLGGSASPVPAARLHAPDGRAIKAEDAAKITEWGKIAAEQKYTVRVRSDGEIIRTPNSAAGTEAMARVQESIVYKASGTPPSNEAEIDYAATATKMRGNGLSYIASDAQLQAIKQSGGQIDLSTPNALMSLGFSKDQANGIIEDIKANKEFAQANLQDGKIKVDAFEDHMMRNATKYEGILASDATGSGAEAYKAVVHDGLMRLGQKEKAEQVATFNIRDEKGALDKQKLHEMLQLIQQIWQLYTQLYTAINAARKLA